MTRLTAEEVLAMSDDEIIAARRAGQLEHFGASKSPQPNPAQGASGGEPKGSDGQLTRADLQRMTPEQISDAHEQGRFADLLAGRVR